MISDFFPVGSELKKNLDRCIVGPKQNEYLKPNQYPSSSGSMNITNFTFFNFWSKILIKLKNIHVNPGRLFATCKSS